MDAGLLMGGIGLAALMIGLFAWLKTDDTRLGERLDKRIDDQRSAMQQEIAELRTETGNLRERVARLDVLQVERR